MFSLTYLSCRFNKYGNDTNGYNISSKNNNIIVINNNSNNSDDNNNDNNNNTDNKIKNINNGNVSFHNS